MSRHRIVLSVVIALVLLRAHGVPAMTIKINDTRENNFYLEALNWVLEKSGKPYQVVSVNYPLSSQARKVAFVKNGNIDVIYAGTSIDLENTLLPVRFPVMRGLSGQRLFIIHNSLQVEYDRVKSIADLKRHTGIQGLGWGDTQVLKAYGLTVKEALYDDIFPDINAGAHLYFPRGVVEVFSEIDTRAARMPNLAVEQKLLLVYKTAVFFFVNPSNLALADMITQGFLNAYADGSYPRFFYNHPLIRPALEKADLHHRIRIEIPNLFLTPETKSIPRQYWHSK